MKTIYMVLLGSVLLTGCATEGKLREHLQSRIGTPINDVIVSAGPPSNVFPLNSGEQLYTWHHSHGRVAQAYTSFGVTRAIASEQFCDIRYTVDKAGMITNYSYYGNTCRSK
jgi:hypothetical protein